MKKTISLYGMALAILIFMLKYLEFRIFIHDLFTGLAEPFDVGLYHSWAADPQTLPPSLRITARSEAGIVMAVRHDRFNVCGVQFHPESVMTPLGSRIIRNWIGT